MVAILESCGLRGWSALRFALSRGLMTVLSCSTAQIGQDFLALLIANRSSSRFFVEFGACDGRRDSNTYILERYYAWNGILAEPGRYWHPSLKAARRAVISTDLVWSRSGEDRIFLETLEPSFSTARDVLSHDQHEMRRTEGVEYLVRTVSLSDLLDLGEAPSHIDFLSIDTEGSELEILEAFDFSRYTFGFICVEHNNTDREGALTVLLQKNGYRRLVTLAEVSGGDGWYLGPSTLEWGVFESEH